MIRSTTIAPAALAAALVLPAAAGAKGASRASVQGPQLKRAIVIPGDGESGGTPLGDLAQHAGFFPAVYGGQPSGSTFASPPKGDLGPRYQVTYVLPGPNGSSSLIHQDVYPYATVGAVSYVRPGQPFWGTQKTHGGWYIGGAALRADLVGIGLPAKAPTPGGITLHAGALAGIAAAGAALLLLILGAFRLRRRPQPATA
jgi:hypothetical protein